MGFQLGQLILMGHLSETRRQRSYLTHQSAATQVLAKQRLFGIKNPVEPVKKLTFGDFRMLYEAHKLEAK